MEHITRIDPASAQAIHVVIHDVTPSEHPLDEYREVTLKFADGRRFRGLYWRDPRKTGRSWCDEPGMFVVPDLDRDALLRVVDDCLDHDQIEWQFEELDNQS